jgi:membrane protein implicated in regulation of membrane protease activity
MTQGLTIGIIIYLAAGFLLIPLARLFPKYFSPAKELMTFLVGWGVGGCLPVGGVTFFCMLVLWALWPIAMILGLFVPSLTLDQTIAKIETARPDLIGQRAICLTDLKPSGKISIDGVPYDATSVEHFISKGSEVRVVKKRGFNLVVERA